MNILLPVLLGLGIWCLPIPGGITEQTWQLFAIFVATITGIIFKTRPMGVIAFTGLAALLFTNTLDLNAALSGFSNSVVWLIVFAFFVARGFIKTGLGPRISYFFMILLGKNTLGLSYGLVMTDLMLAPAIPSMTARAGGIVFPILKSLAKNYSDPKQIGAFLVLVSMQATCITSAMFLTSMAANPLLADIGADIGIHISWAKWALAASVPGLSCLIVLPYAIYKLHPPEIRSTPDATEFAKQHLQKMGPMKRAEWIMLATFLGLVALWITGPYLSINATTTALGGLVILLLTNTLNWQDVIEERGAWETLIWFSVLLTMASGLNKLGFTEWFGDQMASKVVGLNWVLAFAILSLTYFYSHYLFASSLAHVGAMYSTFLIVAVTLGTPPLLAMFFLATLSSLFGGLTHYSSGPAALFYGAQYVTVRTWWKVGLIVSVINLTIWTVVGSLWWHLIGLW